VRFLLKFLFTGLLLLLLVALGTEVVALRRSAAPAQGPASPPVVRKRAHPTAPPKTVRPVPRRPVPVHATPKKPPSH